jgi:hypothetical protein
VSDQLNLFPLRVRRDFGLPGWPKHPSAGKRAEIRGPLRLADGRELPEFARVWVDDGYGERNMALDDLEHA